jgi:hypothetical protein
MASIAYILAHAVNVRRLDISHQIVGNMEPDSLKNLTRLEHLSLYGYGEWNKTFDDLGNVPPVLPRLAPCPNLRVLDIGSFFGDSLGDIGACPRLERLHLELDEDEEAHRSIIATMPKHVGRLVSPNARTIT